MKSISTTVVCCCLASMACGCSRDVAKENVADNRAATSAPADVKSIDPEVAASATSGSKWADADNPIDYSSWTPLSDKPKRIPLNWFTRCVVLPSMEKIQSNLGPHYVPMVKLLANPLAADNLALRHEKPLPVGAAIVKEKWLGKSGGFMIYELDESGPGEYGAMIKREAGYDPEHGDWEYVFVTRSTPLTVERGKLETCRECHSKARETDYLFLPELDEDHYPE